MAKSLPAQAGDPGSTLAQEDPWRRTWQPVPVFSPGGSHAQRSLAGYSPPGRRESDTTEALAHTLRCKTWVLNSFVWMQTLIFLTHPASGHGRSARGHLTHQSSYPPLFLFAILRLFHGPPLGASGSQCKRLRCETKAPVQEVRRN